MSIYALKFSYVAVCFIIALTTFYFSHSKKDWLCLSAALALTLISDYFLVLTHNHAVGVFLFCFVHIAYLLRISGNKDKSLAGIWAAALAGAALYVVILIIPIFPGLNLLLSLAAVYALLFLQNLVAHIKYYRSNNEGELPKFNKGLILAGLILFALCDIHVMLFNLPNFVQVPQFVSTWGRAWIWVFYAPSQMLLSLSAVK